MTSKISFWCAVVSILACLAGCGDSGSSSNSGTDSSVGTGTDGSASVNPNCPMDAPQREGLLGACCFRKYNGAGATSPGFRVSSLVFNAPSTLANTLVSTTINLLIDAETFNWLFQLENAGSPGTVTLHTGGGQRNSDGTYTFFENNAQPPGDADRWNRFTWTNASLNNETFSAPEATRLITVPGFRRVTGALFTQFPILDAQVPLANMSVGRSCIGTRVNKNNYDASQGTVKAFMTVDNASSAPIEIEGMSSNLCNLIAGFGFATDDCRTKARATWAVKPDSECDQSGCTKGNCDPSTSCNAWEMSAAFSAQGIDIVDNH